MEVMDWGGFEDFVRFGEVRESEVDDDCSYYLIIAPQNVVGSCILDYLKEMVQLPNPPPEPELSIACRWRRWNLRGSMSF